eukprot:CAMPEP_0179264718 /NCGR_PEP_ID=MMETSP0797-20121207/28534_1 /TAXON_ID=47934 /ORGANISM="Dinophysis acuminata, Strain DAEP01" /LENGTH=80 /DNA_ID=CAMNT_0020972907 /DNA_START=209 /DNA_END=451 /DNA_ORIENTATION=-
MSRSWPGGLSQSLCASFSAFRTSAVACGDVLNPCAGAPRLACKHSRTRMGGRAAGRIAAASGRRAAAARMDCVAMNIGGR